MQCSQQPCSKPVAWMAWSGSQWQPVCRAHFWLARSNDAPVTGQKRGPAGVTDDEVAFMETLRREGATYREIAEQVGYTAATVRYHCQGSDG